MPTKTWTVQVTLEEEEDDTRADATLQLENKMEMRGRGFSRRNPHDESEPRIGEELATARHCPTSPTSCSRSPRTTSRRRRTCRRPRCSSDPVRGHAGRVGQTSHDQGHRASARASSGCRARSGCSRPVTGSTCSRGTCRWRRRRRSRPRSWYPYRAYPFERVDRLVAHELPRASRRSPRSSGTGVRMRARHGAAPHPHRRPVVARGGPGADPRDRARTAVRRRLDLRGAGRGDAGLPALARRPASRRSAARSPGWRSRRCRTGPTWSSTPPGSGPGGWPTDPSLLPVRGQVVYVEQVGLDRWWLDGAAARRTSCRARTTSWSAAPTTRGSGTARPDPDVAKRILERAIELVPELAPGRRRRAPGRPAPGAPARAPGRRGRTDGTRVVHCYGHGGAGVTLSWGCADEVAALARASA